MKLDAVSLNFSYRSHKVLNNINLSLGPMIIAVIGPNGAGKTTLIKCIAGILRPLGAILFNGKKVGPSYREFYTREMSYLPQSIPTHAVINVFEAVLLGLMHSLTLRVGEADVARVTSVLKLLGIEGLAQRRLNELSGGQQQMVSIAQAIVKEPRVILLDEPLSSLDIHHQFEILNHIKNLTYERETITVIAFHDLNLAARYANLVVVLNKGEVYACGSPQAVLNPEMLRAVYKVDARVTHDGVGVPVIYPLNIARPGPSVAIG